MRTYSSQKPSFASLVGSLVILFVGYQALVLFVKRQTGIVMGQPSFPLWVWTIIIEIIFVYFGYTLYRYYRLQQAGIHEIDRMTGGQFEEKLSIVFSQLGYSVQHIGKSGDYGVDLIISKNGIRTAVQAKRYGPKEHVDNTAIQKLDAGMRYYHCNEALVVTTSTYTPNARHAAAVLHVSLWDRNKLIDMLFEVRTGKKN